MRNDDRLIASVAVEGTVYHFDRAFDYAVPMELADTVRAGCRVNVPFARGNMHRQAMVMSIKKGDDTGLKYITSVLDREPIMSENMLSLAEFMHKNYYCTLYEAVKAMLPAGVNYDITPVYSAVDVADISNIDDTKRQIYEYVKGSKHPVKRDVILRELGLCDSIILDKMTREGLLKRDEDAFRRIGDKSMRMLRLSADADDFSGKLTEKQQSVVDLIYDAGEASVKEICYYTGVTQGVVDAVVKKGIAEYYDCEVLRNPVTEYVKPESLPILNDEQQTAYDGLCKKFTEDKASVSLLYGVTGSGKTAVFMNLIKTVVSSGKDVIVMVPEIALTPQLINRFRGVFGDDVAVFHSALSLGERLDEFKRVERGLVHIAVGTRSAVFAPFKNLGLIIMDEEQEHTYKSENKPRYHARDIAKFRCAKENCMLLLSSATPDVESYYYAKSGRYSLFELHNRFGDAVLPDVITVDMNEEQSSGNTTGISSALLSAIEDNLNNRKQTILLLNRRGYNTFVTCRKCKEPVVCPNCSISLTYHSANNRLMCHYCGHSEVMTGECPSCHEHSLRFGGQGTQRAEETLCELFPQARILRMDADAVVAKNSHEKLLSAFSRGEYDILVGTQMVAKGLDFPNVTLVGVLSADQVLYSDDYRSFERAFSMLTQVVGRSGRGSEKGRAVIQTYTPENPIIELSSRQDYDGFYEDEIELRRSMKYPPFADLLLIGFLGEVKRESIECSRYFIKRLEELCRTEYTDIPVVALGPSPALVSKVNNKYRYKIILKSRNSPRLRELIAYLLAEFGKNKEYRRVTVYVDLKPLSF